MYDTKTGLSVEKSVRIADNIQWLIKFIWFLWLNI